MFVRVERIVTHQYRFTRSRVTPYEAKGPYFVDTQFQLYPYDAGLFIINPPMVSPMALTSLGVDYLLTVILGLCPDHVGSGGTRKTGLVLVCL